MKFTCMTVDPGSNNHWTWTPSVSFNQIENPGLINLYASFSIFFSCAFFPLAFFIYLFCFSSFNLLFYWCLHTCLCVGYYNLPPCLSNKTFFRMHVYDKCKYRYKTNSSDIALPPCLIRNGAYNYQT